MSFIVGLKAPYWDLNKSVYEEVSSWPLMSSPGPVLMILAGYLLFVLKLGPSYMRKREAYKLTNILLIYNAVQVAYSAFLVVYFGSILLQTGLVPKQCCINDNGIRQKILYGIFFYFLAKVSEFLDTIFFVLRKKYNQVTFLHVYHHSIMMMGTWSFLKYSPSHGVLFIGFLNSLVHVAMYAYYGLSALGPNVAKYLWWKKYMTTFQLVQFVSMLIHYAATIVRSECPPTKFMSSFIACNISLILLLFLNFYRQSYIKKPKKLPATNGVDKKQQEIKSQ